MLCSLEQLKEEIFRSQFKLPPCGNPTMKTSVIKKRLMDNVRGIECSKSKAENSAVVSFEDLFGNWPEWNLMRI